MLRQENHLHLGGGGCGKPRSRHCTLAWAKRAKLCLKKKEEEKKKRMVHLCCGWKCKMQYFSFVVEEMSQHTSDYQTTKSFTDVAGCSIFVGSTSYPWEFLLSHMISMVLSSHQCGGPVWFSKGCLIAPGLSDCIVIEIQRDNIVLSAYYRTLWLNSNCSYSSVYLVDGKISVAT